MSTLRLAFHATALMLFAGTAGCFLSASKSKTPERQYTAAEQELRADYKLAKASKDRELSACIWDYTKLQEKVEAGPQTETRSRTQTDSGCQRALEKGTKHPDLANKYVGKFAKLDGARDALVSGNKKLENENAIGQCITHVRGFESKREGVNVAGALSRCIERFEKIPELEQADISATKASLDELATRHVQLLADYARMKQDTKFVSLVDSHLVLLDEEAMLRLRIRELKQLRDTPELSEANSVAQARLRKVQQDIKANFVQREPYYEKYGLTLQ